MKNDPTNAEILEAVQIMSSSIDKQLVEIKGELAGMVTKDYLDDKLSDLRGDLTVLMRKEDRKVRRLIEMLRTKNVIGEPEVRELFALEPFPESR